MQCRSLVLRILKSDAGIREIPLAPLVVEAIGRQLPPSWRPADHDQLTARLAEHGRAIRPATIQVALDELVAAELVASTGEDGQHCWRALPTARDPLLEAVDLHGAHDRHTTPEMATRAVDAIQQRLTVVLGVAELAVEHHPNRPTLRVF